MDASSKLRAISLTFVIYTISWMDGVHCALSTCGGTLRGRTRTFTSPNYPHSPKRAPEAAAVGTFASDGDSGIVTCEWKIIVPAGRGIQLNFGDFDMAAGLDECTKGELEVFSGIDANRRSLDKYCGSDELDTVQLTTNEATVVFRRPAEFSGKGFLVSYIETTPGVVINDFVTCVDRGSDHVGVGSYSVLCPGGCADIADMFIRGIGSYRDDSYLCKAAVHAGVISDVAGGRIDVKKLPGETLYMGSEANGVTSDAGAMSDTMFGFIRPDAGCDDRIEFRQNQLTASSYWTGDETDLKKTNWRPDKAILGKQLEAWSPNNPTSEQWLQVDLKEPKVITAITTRGSSEKYYTTKSYRIAYRNDTRLPWRFYKEDGVSQVKDFVGNQHIFKETQNNFIHPRIVGRFIRIYPAPVVTEKLRYCLQIALSGCDIEDANLIDLPVVPEKPGESVERSASTIAMSTTMNQRPREIVGSRENVSKNLGTTQSPSSNVEATSHEQVQKPISPTGGGKPTMNESSIIVIAIVAALAVTSILLAALVLILVRKRKKKPKDGLATAQPLQTVQNNNNTRPSYKSKKSRKRKPKNMGEHFENADYRDTLLQASMPTNTTGANHSATLPADQGRLLNGRGTKNGRIPALPQNGAVRQHDGSHNETNSFTTDDEGDHEYHVIDDEQLLRNATASNGGHGSKGSTASSLGNHTQDVLQLSCGVGDNEWNRNSPHPTVFPTTENVHDHLSTFATNPNTTGVIHPHFSRNHVFPHETRYLAEDVPSFSANLKRENVIPPSHMQRRSTSSNNSSHGASSYPREQGVPYYPPIPNTEPNPDIFGGPTTADGIEVLASVTKRAPSYKVPRPLEGGIPALPDKVGNGGISAVQNGRAPFIGPGPSSSPSTRSDYDRLYRNNTTGRQANNTNNFAVIDGSQSQYNQLNLNGANV